MVYGVGFIGGFFVPRSIDSGLQSSLGKGLFVDIFLLGVFAFQHSLMARKTFKERWTRFVPVFLERSAFVLIASLVMVLVFFWWRPINVVVWSFENSVVVFFIWILFWLGWLLVLVSFFLIDASDLFGLKQVYLNFVGLEEAKIEFVTPGFYRFVRHPMMLGLLIAFWAAPHMSVGHLLFASFFTIYIFVGIFLEERDHQKLYGDVYREYQQRVPMLIPNPSRYLKK
jgi:protein-S-isoprenylcysteine O-methyltransferase Ste14